MKVSNSKATQRVLFDSRNRFFSHLISVVGGLIVRSVSRNKADRAPYVLQFHYITFLHIFFKRKYGCMTCATLLMFFWIHQEALDFGRLTKRQRKGALFHRRTRGRSGLTICAVFDARRGVPCDSCCRLVCHPAHVSHAWR